MCPTRQLPLERASSANAAIMTAHRVWTAAALSSVIVLTTASAQTFSEYITVTGQHSGVVAGCYGAPERCEGTWVVGEPGQIDFNVYLPNPVYGPTDSVRFVMAWPEEWTVLSYQFCGAGIRIFFY